MTLLFAHRTLTLVSVVEFTKRTTLLGVACETIVSVLVFFATDESVVAF
jgi:hypothetical protein